MTTQLYLVPFETPSADKIHIVVEAASPEEATSLAQDQAIEIGALDEDEVGDPNAECYFLEPISIDAACGKPGIRLSLS